MASAAHEEAEATKPGMAQNRKLHKAFKHLKSHASAIANFTLQWQDLEDYIHSLQHQIESRLAQLKSQTVAEPAPQEQKASAPEAQSGGIPDGSVRENARSSPVRGSSGSIPSKDGKSLLLHLTEHMKGRKINRDDLHNALIGAENCGEVVLEAMRQYFQLRESRNGEVPFDATVARKSCMVLLHEFMRGETEIGEKVKQDARRFAVQWKEKLETLEANVFLKYLHAYRLVGDFKEEEIFNIFEGLLRRNNAPEIFRSLGIEHKAPDFVAKLLAQNKKIEAVTFIYAFDLVNQFSPTSLVKEHLNWAKKEAAVARRSGQTAEAWVEAANVECIALSAAVNCIKNHNLESQFPTEALTKRIIQLRKHKSESKKLISRSQSTAQPQQHSGHKRQFPNQPNKQNGNKRHQAPFAKGASRGAPIGAPSSVNPTRQVQESPVAASRNTPNTAIDFPFERKFIPPTYLPPSDPYVPQDIDVSRAAEVNGPTTFRNSTLSATNLRQPPQLSTRGFRSSRPTSVTDGLPSIRNPLPADLHPPRPFLSKYADVSHHWLMDSFPASRQHPFMVIRETEGSSSTSGHYRSAGSSVVPPYNANYGESGATSARLFEQDDMAAGIRSDLAAISAMKYETAMKYEAAGSSSFLYAERSPLVSSTVPRSQHYLHTHDYPAQPSSDSYNSLSSQGRPPRYTL
ncbi:hypothetical protein CRG98_011493 [Punica granatum]|uniref:FRIGIDA-like protein n=1 Tax=Punica granatum TaxID=22663 RepID=A0A2I0KH87_PUNGR|nr:hypothetical protein CRG98_011493 [Punica granatum]